MNQWVDVKKLSQTLQIAPEVIESMLETGKFAIEKDLHKPPTDGNTFLNKNSIRIYQDDFISSTSLGDESVDLIVTSPPYNVGIEYNVHDDDHEYDHYLQFSRNWLQKAHKLSRPDGRLCMNIPLDKNKGGQQSVCADITTIAKEVGWKYHSTIIWNEGNISRRTAWGSWLSASAPYVIAPVEVIVVMYKYLWKKQKRLNQETGIARQEFMDWTNGVWSFNGESKKRIGHPAPFPRELPKRCIKLFSFIGDVVLDPFLGSGTTLLEAFNNSRAGIGFDISLEYCALAQKRLEDLWRQANII